MSGKVRRLEVQVADLIQQVAAQKLAMENMATFLRFKLGYKTGHQEDPDSKKFVSCNEVW